MKTHSLNGKWHLTGRYHNDSDNEFKEVSIIGNVPGNVELDLLDNGFFKDFYYGSNILQLNRNEFSQWEYYRDFEIADDFNDYDVELKFEGVDTIAAYYINGVEIGRSENMLTEHSFLINRYIKSGKNSLAVKLFSTVEYASEKEQYSYMTSFPENFVSLSVRQAPHMYGWDIMPKAVTYGIWKSVYINYKNKTHIDNVYLSTLNADKDSACIWFQYNLKIRPELYGKTYVKISGSCEESSFTYSEKVKFKTNTVRLNIDKPKLWFPRGYGKANLYEVVIELYDDNGVIDTYSLKFGIRKVELLTNKLKNNYDFTFCINGYRILIKGTNYVPADVFHSRDIHRYKEILDKVIDCNCNLVRCWGGNVYESDEFFDYCDEKGIMVWQDFAFACSLYPISDEFKNIVSTEIKKTVLRLRNHCSIILYCGDNECDYGFYQFGLDPKKNKITREIIPDILFLYDCFRAYTPSSPYYNDEFVKSNGKGNLAEDHLWGPRDYYKSSYYSNNKASFISEIGYHGCPGVKSIKKFISPENLFNTESDEWILHCTSPAGTDGPFNYRIKLMCNQVKVMFKDKINNINDFALASQITQAEALKYFIEQTRMLKFNKSGIIWWNIQDGWPQFSDAVVDWYGNAKLAYYYIKKSQQPVTICMSEPSDWHIKVMVCNDTLNDINGKFEVFDEDYAIIKSGDYNCEANSNTIVSQIRVLPSETKLFLLRLTTQEGEEILNHYITGYPPYRLEKYKGYLKKISNFTKDFDFNTIAE